MKRWMLALGLGLLTPLHGVSANVGFQRVGDADTAPAPVGSDPYGFLRFGNEVIFGANTPATGTELFATTGVVGNVRLVADLAPAGASSTPRVLGRIGSRLIVSAELDDPGGGPFGYMRHHQIVSLDPVTGAHAVLTQFAPWNSEPALRFEELGQSDDAVAFRDHSDGSIWASDGTVLGTQRLHAGTGVQTASFCATQDRFVFAVSSGAGLELWASNGQTLGTAVIAALPQADAQAKSRGDACYLLTGSDQPERTVWLSDGTAGGTGVFAQVPGGGAGYLHVVGDDALVFVANGAQSALWRAGAATPAWSGSASISRFPAVVVGERLVFSIATDFGERAFASDGTAAGTVALQYEGSTSMPWAHAMPFYPRLYAGDGYALVRTTSMATYRIDPATAQVSAVPVSTSLFGLGTTAVLDGAVFGVASSSAEGREIWRSDGTAAGTHRVADVATATRSGAQSVTAAAAGASGMLFYAAQDDVDAPAPARHSLWRSDGTAAGTSRMPRAAYDEFTVTHVQAQGDGVVFTTLEQPPNSGGRLYRSDATSGTTTLLWEQALSFYDLRTTSEAAFFNCPAAQAHTLCAVRADSTEVVPLIPGGSWFEFVGVVDNIAFFITPQGLLRSDGTTAGTAVIAPGMSTQTSGPLVSQRLGNRLLFRGCTAGNQASCGLYASDGSDAGTQLVSYLYWPIRFMAPLHDGVAFVTEGPERQLWVSDGSAMGTRLVLTLQAPVEGMASTGQRVHLIVANDFPAPDYLVSDGSPPDTPGTHWVFMPAGIRRDVAAVPIAVDANNVVFRCYVQRAGVELCGIDDSAADAVYVVGDFYPGPRSSAPHFIAYAGGRAYFSIDDGRHGAELWRQASDTIFADAFGDE